jgi:hypothetical protein
VLRQWFKPITLALSADGIALRAAGQLPRMLTSASAKLPTSELLLKAFADALQDEALQKSGKRIRLVLSNHFVRYSVLPWQAEIISREDWLAIARHDFRKRYGVVAERWKICVSLNGFGQNVVAAAIDESLIDGLSGIAQEHGCKLVAIEPFLMAVLKHYPAGNDKHWLLIAEPERVLLCEMADNQWQRFSVIAPPHQQELEQALLLVQRSLNSVEPEKRPAHILNCSAPLLTSAASAEWRSEQITFKAWPSAVATNRLAPAALWMAGF